MKRIIVIIIVFVSFFAAACKKVPGTVLRMATTTSTDSTGLLDYLKPVLQKDTGIELQWISVGTGKALEMGRNCDVDILLVHAPDAEKKYINDGFGINRTEVMYNDFIIAGPPDDPAKIAKENVVKAFKKIAAKKSFFISRGDKSGTNIKEQLIWKSSRGHVPAKADWYIETGQGMMRTLMVASEKKGYTITDRATFIKYKSVIKNKKDLVVIVEGGDELKNQYSVIEVNPGKCPSVKSELSKKFTKWIVSGKIQKIIGEFRLLESTLFRPNAKK